ncbi:hypothetical protein EDC17_10513 [Sphingobacterium alimentarium]|uniref:Uncharacterized protein n=1 Tax=Sphingobacterium alimentarium TaxID=797292 RepID=A0A4R3VMS7_9SPHI|nr:hypothetical protein [Sphingobacterium alimentarium]TCV07981.1 hypothetical protein EDC17_10513 [Sphingobacterium alimentarium]
MSNFILNWYKKELFYLYKSIDMNKIFSLELALDYCKAHNVNMLFTEQDYLEEHAVFEPYTVREDLLVQIMIKSHNEKIRKNILPVEILRRKCDFVIFEISEVKHL